jgi:LPXTG-motif cell wall-anchored protein
MNRGSKKGVLAALGAPVALTLTLGALPAYAGGGTTDEAEPKTTSTEKKDKRYDDEKDKSTKSDARAKADARANAKADAKTDEDTKVESDGETSGTGDVRAKAKAKADARAEADAGAKAKAKADARAEADVRAKAGAKSDGRANGQQGRSDEEGRSEGKGNGSSDIAVRGNSASTITLEGCYLSSSKDISYIDFQGEGAAAGKDETIGTTDFDLTTVADIDSITSVEVKAGTTVKTFVIDCAADGTAPGDDNGDSDKGDSGKGDSDKGDSDKGDSDKGHSDKGHSDKGHSDKGDSESGTPGNSAATITLEGCYLTSSKDISYIDFIGDGTAAGKDETIGTTDFDLTSVAGIDDITSVEVKAGTTVESFAIDCAADGTAPGDHPDEGESGKDEDHSDEGESGKDEDHSDEGGSGKDEDHSDEGGSGKDKDGDKDGDKDDVDVDAGAGGDTGTGNGGTDTETGVKTDADVVAGAEGSAGADAKAGVTTQGGAVLGAEQQQTAPTAPSTAYQPTGTVLPQTGSEESTKMLALGGLGMILAGAATMLGRRRFGFGKS